MNNFFNDLQNEARKIKLSTGEKQAMRVHLYKVMDESPAYTPAQQTVLTEVAARRTTISMYHWLSPRFSVPLAVLLVVGLSSGTAFAAQSALPGDPLYAVKINVNEPVALALATTPQAKAQVNAAVATTRLEEAETLAAQGTLTASTTAQLATNFAEHADAAQTNTATVAAADPGTAAQLGATFDSTLAAHSAILSQLASDSGASTVKQSSDSLAVQVLAQAVQGQTPDNSVQPAQAVVAVATLTSSDGTPADISTDAPAAKVKTFAALAPSAARIATSSGSSSVATQGVTTVVPKTHPVQNQDDSVVALALQAQASTTFATAQTDFATIAPSLDASTTAQVQSTLDALQNMYTQGVTSLGSGNSSDAKNNFNNVLRMAVRLDAFLKAGQKFNGKFLSSLLSSVGATIKAGMQGRAVGMHPMISADASTTLTTASTTDSSIDASVQIQ